MNRFEERCSVHKFSGLDQLPFLASDYSKLKFGSDHVAKKFGYELATKVFHDHAPLLLANKCVVIPSPYNYVQNAASIMARHMCDRLNHYLVHANGIPVEWSVIHRKVSYTNDYGFLAKEQRRALIDNDEFHFNSNFVEGKVLLFVDDVVVTGTHEDKLCEIMDKAKMTNPSLFLYYGEAEKDIPPETEAGLNFAGIQTLEDYTKLTNEPNHHIIVRPIKFLLSRPIEELELALGAMTTEKVRQLYFGCLGEGYHRIPLYQEGFAKIYHYAMVAV